MPFTLWKRGVLTGETDFGLAKLGGRRRAGVFHPTPAGMMVLPALTAMAPALFGLGHAMKRLPLSDEAIERDPDAALDAFERSPEGQKVLAAAEQIAELELRDENGKRVEFESILVTDLEELRTLGVGSKANSKGPKGGDPVRYLISVTLRKRRHLRAFRALGKRAPFRDVSGREAPPGA
ncbi:MAG: hypothetical protein M3282_06305 [Gemmatimonadota bacterium]|nr:hypothetical protein [Gemmatimonadota bacterium]